MTDRAHRGGFITLEGGEGAGKSTQSAYLAARLAAAGVEVVATREPGGSPRAEEIRAAVLSGAAAPFGPLAEALLFSSARIDHIDETIGPALARGAFVVCDRFIDSTRVYQGALGKVDAKLLAAMERVVVGATVPDLTLIFDIDPATGLARAEGRRGRASGPDRFEREGPDFHARVRAAFLAIAEREPSRCRVLHAWLPQAAVADQVWTHVQARFPALAADVAGEVPA